MRIAMVAGEASGDLLAAHLIRALRSKRPDLEFVGIGGPRMQAEGFKAWWQAERLAVNGFADVMRRYRELSSMRRELLARLRSDPPDLFLGVDAPDFNLWLERKLRDAGVRTAHFISPSIWAWRGGRVHAIRKAVDHVLCLFPCEPAIYARHKVPATFVGHPLADEFPLQPDRDAMREQLDVRAGRRVVAMLPGSRVGEVSRLAEPFIQTAQILHERHPELEFMVPLITRQTRLIFEEALYRLGAQELPLRMMFGHSHDAMIASDVVLVASGTATLEAALLKRPMVIAYRLAPLSYHIMKRLSYLRHFGLPNILCGEPVVPEFIQHAVQAPEMADAVERWLSDRDAVSTLQTRFVELHQTLRQNCAERSADVLLQMLAGSPA